MAAPIDLRNDFDSVSLRRLAKRTRDATQSRRLLALAEVYDGGSRTDASRIGGVGLQIIRDWVLRFNARGPDGLVDGKSPGAPSKLNADHRRALAEVVEAGPVPAVDGVVRWRRKDLARWLLETFAISFDETTVGRELKALGFAKISARPRHYAQNELGYQADGAVAKLFLDLGIRKRIVRAAAIVFIGRQHQRTILRPSLVSISSRERMRSSPMASISGSKTELMGTSNRTYGHL